MNRYEIRCTEAQTRKALELGAPLNWGYHNDDFENAVKIRTLFVEIPTTEQMIGWLEEQGVIVEMVKCDTHWFARAYSDENTNFNKGRYASRQAATLAAIDAALEYLKTLKQ